jgi:hypothetical protein
LLNQTGEERIMNNLKIGTRLAMGFGIVVLLMLVLAFVGITRMASLNEGIEKIITDRYPKTVQANDIIDNINTIARAMRNTLLVSSPAEVKEELARIDKARGIIVERFENWRKASRARKARPCWARPRRRGQVRGNAERLPEDGVRRQDRGGQGQPGKCRARSPAGLS